jgi:hypothetical protein
VAIITIGSTDMPEPATYGVTLQDIDSSNTGRTETGLLIRDRIRAGVYKIQVSWQVEHSQIKIITDALAPDKFQVTFFDPTTNTNKTCDMYCGDRSGELKRYRPDDTSKSLWELSVSLIEY